MALPDYSKNKFYDPKSSYGWDPSFKGSRLSDFWFKQNPEFEWTKYLADQNLGGLDNKSDAARGMFGRMSAGYGAARGSNMDLSFRDYLSGQDMQGTLAGMSSEEKGMNRSRYVGRDRWALR